MLVRKDLLEKLIDMANLSIQYLNAKDDDIEWITVKGNHIPIKKGVSKQEAIAAFFKGKATKTEKAKTSNGYSKIIDKVKESNKKNLTADIIINKVLADPNFKYSKQELQEKIKLAEEYNDKAIPTNQMYKNPKTGEYYPERKQKHKEILEKLFENEKYAMPKDGEKSSFIMLGGRGGSGKSKFEGMVYNKKNYIVLDADAIKEMLPDYQGYNAFQVHEESSELLKQALGRAKQKRLNVVLDATMKTEKSVETQLKEFSGAGYDVEMHYMHLPREISSQRALGRFMGKSGRYVPLDVLLSMKNNEENFDKLKKYAKKWSFYDNNVESKETPPKLVAKSD